MSAGIFRFIRELMQDRRVLLNRPVTSHLRTEKVALPLACRGVSPSMSMLKRNARDVVSLAARAHPSVDADLELEWRKLDQRVEAEVAVEACAARLRV